MTQTNSSEISARSEITESSETYAGNEETAANEISEVRKMIARVIVVEGRDDTMAIKRAVNADTIETHGFGISARTWQLLEKADEQRGLIIFTDPDHAGENIRKKVSARFPGSLHAYLDREDARDGDDIGIENARPEAIIKALKKARAVTVARENLFSMEDLQEMGLTSISDSARRRAQIGKILGIGNGNSKAFLKKLNAYGITKEEFYGAISKVSDQEDQE